jgi:uncharacterized membrane protein
MKLGAVRALLLLTLLATLLSFAKFSHCENMSWSTPDQYIHACYSDIPALYSESGLGRHQWVYSLGEKSVEYPVITGVVMWATTYISHSFNSYFTANAILIALLFFALLLLLRRSHPRYWYLLPLSPAVIGSLYINWDLWAIISMVAAIYLFDRSRFKWSAALLGLSVATKFFPIIFLLPIAFILWRRNQIPVLLKYVAITLGTWLAINLPVILTTPSGWWRFYSLNIERSADWGSLWYALSLLGIPLNQLNLLSLLTFLILLAAFALYFFELKFSPTLAEVSFIVMAASTAVNKVYSPQYVLWLAPLAIMVVQKNRSLFTAFWIWQGSELLYHLAIWQHLATYSGAHFGLSDGGYAMATLLRIAATALFIAQIVRFQLRQGGKHAGKAQGRLLDFLFDAGKSYP